MTPEKIERDRAPERIWIDAERTYSATSFSAGIKYIRADLHDAEVQRLRAELAEAEARGYRRGEEEAEKKCAAIAGDPRMYNAERRRGAGMCQAAIRALGEKPAPVSTEDRG